MKECKCDHVERCDCYEDGYAQGKDKAFFELRSIADNKRHPNDCGCQPCITIRYIVQAKVGGLPMVAELDLANGHSPTTSHPVDHFVQRHATELRAVCHQMDLLEGRVCLLPLKPEPNDKHQDLLLINIARQSVYREKR